VLYPEPIWRAAVLTATTGPGPSISAFASTQMRGRLRATAIIHHLMPHGAVLLGMTDTGVSLDAPLAVIGQSGLPLVLQISRGVVYQGPDHKVIMQTRFPRCCGVYKRCYLPLMSVAVLRKQGR